MDEISTTENLIFDFNQAIADVNETGSWDSLSYIEFDPPIPGQFKWMTSDRLIFSPFQPLNVSQSYTGKFLKSMSNVNGDINFRKLPKLEFHTPFLNVTSQTVAWIKVENQDQPMPVLDLRFNIPVDAQQVMDHIQIKADGVEQTQVNMYASTDRSVHIGLSEIKPNDETIEIEVEIDKAIKPVGAKESLKEPIAQKSHLPSINRLTVEEVVTDHNGVNGTIQVSLTQSIDVDQIENHIDLKPNVKFQIQKTASGFNIVSDEFDMNQKYDLKIDKNLKGSLGGKMKRGYSKELLFGEIKPMIEFADNSSNYLASKGNRNLGVRIVNVPKVKVKVYKVYENNIMAFFRDGMYNDWHYDYDEVTGHYDYYDYQQFREEVFGDLIWENEVSTASLASVGNTRLLNIDFADKMQDYKGLYVVQVSDMEKHWLSATTSFSLSDVGVMCKYGKDRIMVFANSLKTAQPISNATINFIGRNNQIIYSSKTNNNGVGFYDIRKNAPTGFNVGMITITDGDDYNYLSLDESRIGTSRFDVGGAYPNLSGMEGFLYGERDIYRPGETIQLAGLVRMADMSTPENVPVKLKIMMPNGNELKTMRKKLNDQGGFEASVVLNPSVPTGSYSAKLYTADDQLLNTQYLQVEEFMPDRIKVQLTSNKEMYKIGDSIQLNIEATNLFGPPAALRNYELQFSLEEKYFAPKKNSGYIYNLKRDVNIRDILRQGRTDAAGLASEVFRISEVYKNTGMLQGQAFATVFDETGRPVNRTKQIEILTQDAFYGIEQGGRYIATRQPVQMKIIAVDKDGNALDNVEGHLELVKYKWVTVLEKDGNRYRYRSQRQEDMLEDKMITISGTEVQYQFTPDVSGQYEVRLRSPKASSYVFRNFYAYGWGDTQTSSFEVNKEGHIDIELDKDSYNVGDRAKVLMKLPFPGKVLMTVESDNVINHFYEESDKKSFQYKIPITSDMTPNVYVTATLIRPDADNDIPLTVAHGFAPILVENPKNHLSLKLKVAEKSRSKRKQQITVKGKAGTEFVIAAVDEGILQLTNYQTPDPFEYFFRKKALATSTYNIYPYLFPELSSKLTQPGGGAGLDMAKRVNPLTNKRVKLVHFWSGLQRIDGDGSSEIEIDIPQFSGNLRVMAVAYKDKAFASADENMIVADPVVISAGVPRFLSPGDKIDVPVTVSNTTKKSMNATIDLITSGLVNDTNDSKQVTIPANSEKQVMLYANAALGIGEGKISVEVKTPQENFVHDVDITVRPASPLQKRTSSGSVENNKSIKLDISQNFIPSSTDVTLTLSRSPVVAFAKDLDYLVRYPHGCGEQTISSAFPQLYFSDLVKNISNKRYGKTDPNDNVQAAIQKLETMQLHSGGITTWSGGGTESWWITAYAAHFMLEAEKAGFEVKKDVVDLMLVYLKRSLKNKDFVTYYYNRTQNKKIAPKEAAYSLYVLALAGQPQKSSMNYYKQRLDNLSLDSKYLLAVSYFLAGDQSSYKELLPSSFKGEESNTATGGSFYSYTRDLGIALNAMLEVEPDHPQIGELARMLSTQMKNKRYLNTQERTFGLLALGKIARANNQSNATARITSNGQSIGEMKDASITLSTKDFRTGNDNLSELDISASDGRVYYFLQTEGVTADGTYLEEDNYLKVRRTYYDRFGQVVHGNAFKQNDLVVVRLELSTVYDSGIDNVVVTDILPAGFEIENPRISSVPELTWVSPSSYEHMDVRDDRIHFYTSIHRGSNRTFYYLARAVSKGTYKVGPVSADAMYQGEYHSYHGAGEVQIVD